jgi:hypothetical protein
MNRGRKTKTADWRATDPWTAFVRSSWKPTPGMIEERKWRKPSNRMAGIPVWSHDGIVCTGETYKNYVKVTFAKEPS